MIKKNRLRSTLSVRIVLVVMTLCMSLAVVAARAQTYALDTISMNGPVANRINFVFVSDGFRKSEMNSYRAGVNAIAQQLFATSPYKEYQRYINIFAIEVPSVESGANHPVTAFDCPAGSVVTHVNSAFGSTFDVGGIHRLLAPTDESGVMQVLFNNFPSFTQAFVLVNTAMYGGSGGTIATASMNTLSAEIAIHEIGHSLSNLGDEYGGSTPYPGSEKPNTTQETQRDAIRWNRWIDAATPIPTPVTNVTAIGLFEGASYNDHGWYRPKANCKMRTLGQPLCAVCAETIADTIQSRVSAIDGFLPEHLIVDVNGSDSVEFSLALVRPIPNTLRVTWTLNGTVVARNRDSIRIDFQNANVNPSMLQAVVEDTTALVRPENGQFRASVVEWTVNHIVNAVAEESNGMTNFAASFDRDRIQASIALPEVSNVRIDLADVAGRLVATLFSGRTTSGVSEWSFPVTGLASGVYVVRCASAAGVASRRIAIVR